MAKNIFSKTANEFENCIRNDMLRCFQDANELFEHPKTIIKKVKADRHLTWGPGTVFTRLYFICNFQIGTIS
jgi:hypothetical protein